MSLPAQTAFAREGSYRFYPLRGSPVMAFPLLGNTRGCSKTEVLEQPHPHFHSEAGTTRLSVCRTSLTLKIFLAVLEFIPYNKTY
jgi:hypothetical protein